MATAGCSSSASSCRSSGPSAPSCDPPRHEPPSDHGPQDRHFEGTYMTKATDNVTLIRRGFEAFNTGDVATLKKIMTSDCVQHMSGSNRFTGDHKGLDNMLKMYGELGALTNGTFRATLNDVYATDHGVIATFTSTGTRNGRNLEQKNALAFTIVD